MQKITPFLWFESQAEEAANFYVDLFNNNPGKKSDSKILAVSKYDKAGAEVSGMPEGSVMVVEFQLEDQIFNALNGGPQFQFSGAVSFVIDCKSQEEVDYFWDKLGEGGETGQCGWINRDKFGLTWQVVPDTLTKLLADEDEEKSGRVMQAMLEMKKINIDELQKAYEGV